MAESIVRLTVEDSSFNAKIKAAAKAFADFGSNVASAGADAFQKFASGATTAKVAFQGFNTVLKANALVFVATLAVQVGAAIGEMIGDWISGANDAEAAQRRLNDELDRTAQVVKGILADSDFNARIAKAAGKSTTEILKMKYEAADAAYNKAMSALFDPNVKVGTKEYDKAKQIFDQAEKARTKAWQDIQVDKTAQQYHTGEYASRGGGGGGSRVGRTDKVVKDSIDEILAKQWETASRKMATMADSLRGEDTGPSDVWKSITTNADEASDSITSLAEALGELNKAEGLPENGTGLPDDVGKNTKSMAKEMEKYVGISNGMLGGINNIVGGLQGLGIEIPKDLQGVMGGIQGLMSIVTGIAAILSIIQTLQAIQTTESTIKSIPVVGWLLSQGGVVHAASGYKVPGNYYSGDQVPALLNSGELVLNMAQQGNLASQLQDNGMQNMNIAGRIKGTDIILSIDRSLKLEGKQLLTWGR